MLFKDFPFVADSPNKNFKRCIRAVVLVVVILLIYSMCLILAIKPSMFNPFPIPPLTNFTNHTAAKRYVKVTDQWLHISQYITISILVVLGVVGFVVMLLGHYWSTECFHLLFVTAFAKYSKPNLMKLKKPDQQ